MASGYCYTDRDKEKRFSSVLLFTEAGGKQTVHGVHGKSINCMSFLPFQLSLSKNHE